MQHALINAAFQQLKAKASCLAPTHLNPNIFNKVFINMTPPNTPLEFNISI